MARIYISFKIFPSDITVDLDELKKKIEAAIPKSASIIKFEDDPIAYGLVALIAHITIPEDEDGLMDTLEKKIKEIDDVSQIETLIVSRI